MDVVKWLKTKAAIIGLAMSNVEKNAFSQNGEGLENNHTIELKKDQGNLLNSLIRGEVTQEVKTLRWRMYKAFESSKKYGVGKNRKLITKQLKDLSSFKVDPFDDYPVEMIVFNNEMTIEFSNVPENDKISNIEYSTQNKAERPIVIYRDSLVKFDIEKYTKKLVIRKINDKERLLSFCVSQYPDEENRTTRLFISEVRKAMANPRGSNMLDINRVGFITDSCAGVPDSLEYQYKILSFEKIDEFDGEYILKFKSEVIIDGINLVEQYRDAELDERYEKKEKRPVNVNYTDIYETANKVPNQK